MLKAIVLDFDGVILESVDIKTRAFQAVFQDYPEYLERITRLHLENGGMSRYEKFAIIYRDYLRKPLPAQEQARLGREFSRYVEDEILTCSFVPGALEFLEQQSQRLPLFVVSGTPQAELYGIVKRRGLERYFRGAYGSPRSKEVLLRAVLSEHGWQASEAVFIGDSLTDCQAATAVGMPFICRRSDSSSPVFSDSSVAIVSDLKELTKEWTTILAHLPLQPPAPH